MKTAMKKTAIEINAIEGTITVSKAFYKKASVFGSAEYIALREAMRDNPTFKIVFKTIEKKTYSGLTFQKMEDYIKTQPDSDKMLAKFAAVQRIAKAKGSLYPLTKKWFLNAYPSYKDNEISDAEAKAEALAELEALSDSNNTLSEVA